MTYSAVFFDAGETLLHPHPSFPDLFVSVLRREGFDIDERAVHDRVHVISDRFSEAARDEELWTTSPERSRAFWLSVYGDFLAELGVPAGNGLGATLYAEFTDLSNYSLFEDVLPVLERLREAGLILGVVSNFEEWLGRLLDDLGVGTFFRVRVVSGVEGIEKPDPGIFRLALARAQVDAEASVYVGDNPEFDVEPAAGIGMFPVLIDRRGRHPDHDAVRIRSMAELPEVVGIWRR